MSKMSLLLNRPLDQLQQFFIELIPHHRALNLRIIECSAGHVLFELPFCESLVGNPSTGEVHEGAVTTLIDTACGSVVLTRMADIIRSATLDLRIDFLRKCQSGFNIRCEAECLRITDHVAFVRALVHEGNITDPLAIAAATFAVFTRKPSGRTDSNGQKCHTNAKTDDVNPMACNDIQRIISTIPYARMMGIDLRGNDENMVGCLTYSEHLIGNPTIPAIHGGALVSLLQITATAQVMMAIKSTRIPRIFSCSIEYLLTPKPINTFAVATVMSRSRRFANVRVLGYQERPDQVIAAATVQFLLID